MRHGKQFQEDSSLGEERPRILRSEFSFIACPAGRGPRPERPDHRSDRPPAVEPGAGRSQLLHQFLLHERSHLLERKQRHAVGNLDPFLHGQAVEQRRVVSDIQPFRQFGRPSFSDRS